jgi:hypothetical protein
MLDSDERAFLISLFSSSLDSGLQGGLNIRNLARNMGTARDLFRKVIVLAASEPDAFKLHQRVEPFLDMPLRAPEVATAEQPIVDEVEHGSSGDGLVGDGSTRI